MRRGYVARSIGWPGKDAMAFIGQAQPSLPYERFGSLITEHTDASGMLYRRNRYYDPQTGRFIQPDRIGSPGDSIYVGLPGRTRSRIPIRSGCGQECSTGFGSSGSRASPPVMFWVRSRIPPRWGRYISRFRLPTGFRLPTDG